MKSKTGSQLSLIFSASMLLCAGSAFADPTPGSTGYAEIRWGSNGASGGTPELTLGTLSQKDSDRFTWDSTISSGADSGAVPFTLTVTPGNTTLSIGSGTPVTLSMSDLSYSTDVYGIEIEAVVADTQSSVSFGEGNYAFYTNVNDASPSQTVVTDPITIAATSSSACYNVGYFGNGPDGSGFKKLVYTSTIRFQDGNANPVISSGALLARLRIYTD